MDVLGWHMALTQMFARPDRTDESAAPRAGAPAPGRAAPKPPEDDEKREEFLTIIRQVVAAPVLLVATDFDGVLAPITQDPGLASADGVAVDALRRLAWTPRTRAAVISGRGLEDLRRRLAVNDGMLLIGSHGAEIRGEPTPALPASAGATLAGIAGELRALAAGVPGAVVELKPRGVALHYRRVEAGRRGGCLQTAVGLRAAYPGLRVRLGSMVVEFTADAVTKGDAIRYARQRLGASTVVFVGDDLTDEDAFAALTAEDAGVKVGDGATAARFRLRGEGLVGGFLRTLADERAAWLASRRAR